MEVTKSELDLFSRPGVQTEIQNSDYLVVHPITKFNGIDGSIEFDIQSQSDFFTDPSSIFLNLVARLQFKDGSTKITNDYKAYFTNNALHSMFSSVEVYLNETKISTPSNHYGYRGYITNLLNYSVEGKNTKLVNEGFLTSYNDWEYKSDFLQSNQHEISLCGRLHTDLFFQPKLLPPGLNIRIRLHRAPVGFDVYNTESVDDPNNLGKELCMNIISASLHIRRVKLYPHKMLAVENELSKNNIIIPIKRVDVKSLAYTAGMARYQFDNIINGQLPVKVILGVVKHSAALGNPKENPYEFSLHKMTEICLLRNGSPVNIPFQIGNKTNKCSFPKISYAYSELFSSSSCGKVAGCGVSLKKF